jgi:hypothetical protein
MIVMPPKRRAADSQANAARLHKRARNSGKGTESQPVELDNTHPSQLAEAATQATDGAPFESQLLTVRAEVEIVSPAPGSKAATVATIEDGGGSDRETYGELYTDNYDSID